MGTDEPQSTGPATPIFGLKEEQLLALVESIADEPVESFGVSIEHEVTGHYGYQAEKLIPTFAYLTRSGQTGTTAAFAKFFREPGPREAHHYTYLAQHQAPIPRMYGTVMGPDEREIIFLEYLRPAGDLHPFRWFFSDEDRLRHFLALAARFNAIRPSEEYETRLYHQPIGDVCRWLNNGAEALGRIWERAATGELGPTLRDLCAASGEKLPLLQGLAADLVAPVSRMAVGLVHGDYYPDSTGWRRDTGELLMVDLEGVRLAPRFSDVGRWLGAPDAVQPRCLPREELARHYLAEYARWGGSAVPLEQFLEETRLLCLKDALKMLPFAFNRALDGGVDWTRDREEGRRVYRDEVHGHLTILLREVGGSDGRSLSAC